MVKWGWFVIITSVVFFHKVAEGRAPKHWDAPDGRGRHYRSERAEWMDDGGARRRQCSTESDERRAQGPDGGPMEMSNTAQPQPQSQSSNIADPNSPREQVPQDSFQVQNEEGSCTEACCSKNRGFNFNFRIWPILLILLIIFFIAFCLICCVICVKRICNETAPKKHKKSRKSSSRKQTCSPAAIYSLSDESKIHRISHRYDTGESDAGRRLQYLLNFFSTPTTNEASSSTIPTSNHQSTDTKQMIHCLDAHQGTQDDGIVRSSSSLSAADPYRSNRTLQTLIMKLKKLDTTSVGKMDREVSLYVEEFVNQISLMAGASNQKLMRGRNEQKRQLSHRRHTVNTPRMTKAERVRRLDTFYCDVAVSLRRWLDIIDHLCPAETLSSSPESPSSPDPSEQVVTVPSSKIASGIPASHATVKESGGFADDRISRQSTDHSYRMRAMHSPERVIPLTSQHPGSGAKHLSVSEVMDEPTETTVAPVLHSMLATNDKPIISVSPNKGRGQQRTPAGSRPSSAGGRREWPRSMAERRTQVHAAAAANSICNRQVLRPRPSTADPSSPRR